VSSGLSVDTAFALWGRYEPTPTLDGLRDAAVNHATAEGVL